MLLLSLASNDRHESTTSAIFVFKCIYIYILYILRWNKKSPTSTGSCILVYTTQSSILRTLTQPAQRNFLESRLHFTDFIFLSVHWYYIYFILVLGLIIWMFFHQPTTVDGCGLIYFHFSFTVTGHLTHFIFSASSFLLSSYSRQNKYMYFLRSNFNAYKLNEDGFFSLFLPFRRFLCACIYRLNWNRYSYPYLFVRLQTNSSHTSKSKCKWKEFLKNLSI